MQMHPLACKNSHKRLPPDTAAYIPCSLSMFLDRLLQAVEILLYLCTFIQIFLDSTQKGKPETRMNTNVTHHLAAFSHFH